MPLLLRHIKFDDREALCRLANNEKVCRYLNVSFPHPYTMKDAERFITEGCSDGIYRAMEYDGHFAGIISVKFNNYDGPETGELGYWLGEEFWGKGIASVAIAQITQITFTTTDISKIYTPIAYPNKASIRVMEKKRVSIKRYLPKCITNKRRRMG